MMFLERALVARVAGADGRADALSAASRMARVDAGTALVVRRRCRAL